MPGTNIVTIALKYLKHLEILNISDTDIDTIETTKLSHLRELDISETKI